MLYSLVETAKANQLNTYKYFELLLTEIPKHMEDSNLRFLNELMPSFIDYSINSFHLQIYVK
ncbi:MAG: transposase domain-containing protein [Acetatifactor sp.]|nr:transposase domain-containing protein [Acetatifactor sp.]